MNKNINFTFGLIGGIGLMIPLILISCIPSIDRLIFFNVQIYQIVYSILKITAFVGFYAVLFLSSLLAINGIRSVFINK